MVFPLLSNIMHFLSNLESIWHINRAIFTFNTTMICLSESACRNKPGISMVATSRLLCDPMANVIKYSKLQLLEILHLLFPIFYADHDHLCMLCPWLCSLFLVWNISDVVASLFSSLLKCETSTSVNVFMSYNSDRFFVTAASPSFPVFIFPISNCTAVS